MVLVGVMRRRSVKATRGRRRVMAVRTLAWLRERPDDRENGRGVGTAVTLGHEIPFGRKKKKGV